MDLFKLLKEDHESVKKQFKALVDAEEIEQQAVEKLCTDLTIHAELEEQLLYPPMLEIEKAQEITAEAIEEHKEAKKIIAEIQAGGLDKTQLKVKIEMLQLAIEHHIEEEEGELFPEAKSNLSDAKIKDISERMEVLKHQKLNNPLLKK